MRGRRYVRDRRGRFARTGRGFRRASMPHGRSTSSRKPTSKKKAPTRKKKAVKATYDPKGVKRAMRGKSINQLSRQTGLSPKQVKRLSTKWKTKGVSGKVIKGSKKKATPKGHMTKRTKNPLGYKQSGPEYR